MALYLTGVEAAMSQIASILSRTPDTGAEGMNDVVLDIGGRAADRAPVETGALRGSMEHSVTVEGDEIVGEIRFTEKYAAAQHEHLEYSHPLGGEAKYLERSAIEKADEVRKKMGEQYEQLFGGG